MIELLSPAGSPEAVIAAVQNGADAVYLAGRRFGMRQASENFSLEELAEAAEYLHSRGRKMYLTVNILPHGPEYPALREFSRECAKIDIAGYIVADLGVPAEECAVEVLRTGGVRGGEFEPAGRAGSGHCDVRHVKSLRPWLRVRVLRPIRCG